MLGAVSLFLTANVRAFKFPSENLETYFVTALGVIGLIARSTKGGKIWLVAVVILSHLLRKTKLRT